MGITDISNNIRLFMLPALIIIGIEFILIALYYFYYYRKLPSDRKKQKHIKKLLIVAIFIGYIFFVLELTIFGRGTSHYMQMNLHPFSSYIEAWHKYSLRDLQNCIFNILMFTPLGFMLPLISQKFKVFKWLLLVVVSATVSIETYQTLSGAGIFELDDIINNSLGGIIGYQLYRLFASIAHHKKVKIKSLIGNLAIPLLLGLIFVGMNIVYAQQEFGNLGMNYYIKLNMSDVDVSTSLELSTAPTVAPVYKKIIVNNNEVVALLQQKLGFRELDVQVFNGDREILLEDKSGSQYTLYINSEGYWSFKENNYTPEQTSIAAQEPMIEKAKAIIDELAIQTKDAELTVLENGEFEWSLPDSHDFNKNYWTGDILLGLKQDGSVYLLEYSLKQNQFIREVNILSPTEVYERINKGEFPKMKRNAMLTEEQIVIKKGDQLKIETIELSYMYDSKGFYQPIYEVSGKLNGNDWFTLIQARR